MSTNKQEKKKRKKAFLGGTCNGSTWRDVLVPKLHISYYNPVVSEWTEHHRQVELQQRAECDYCVYVLTPKMVGVYAVAEAVDDSNKRPEKVVFCFLTEDDGVKFQDERRQIDSLRAVGGLIVSNGGVWVQNLDELASYLNDGDKDIDV